MDLNNTCRVTVIIPTLCEAKRAAGLERAILSIQNSSHTSVKILLVINGQYFDHKLVASLKNRTDIKVLQIAEGSAPLAHSVGRQAVTTELFSFLDDDDELLPNALDIRIKKLDNNKNADVIVCNGYKHINSKDMPVYTDIESVPKEPLKSLYRENWLSSCNSMFRTSSIKLGYFDDPHPYMEWTWLAYKLCMNNITVIVANDMTFRCYDTPDSLSKSSTFMESRVTLYQRMLAMNPPTDIRNIIKNKKTNAWHDISEHELTAGRRFAATRAHLFSLTSHISGIKYLPYSRHIIFNYIKNIYQTNTKAV